MSVAVAALLLAMVVVNVVATFRVWADRDEELDRKLVQSAVTWLIPLLGGVVIWSFHSARTAPRRKYSGSGGDGELSSGATDPGPAADCGGDAC